MIHKFGLSKIVVPLHNQTFPDRILTKPSMNMIKGHLNLIGKDGFHLGGSNLKSLLDW